ELFETFPLQAMKQALRSLPPALSYSNIGPELRARLDSLQSRLGAHRTAQYLKLTLASLIQDALPILAAKAYPDSVGGLFNEWFTDVLSEFDSQPDSYYDHRNDGFLKDLAVCSLRMTPVGGAWAVEICSIGRRFLVAGGPRQLMRGLWLLLVRTHGIEPFYLIHTVARYHKRFNPEARDRCYLRVADMLRMNPRVRGFSQHSWYYDPALEGISPHLSAYRRRLVDNGGYAFRLGTSADDIHNATLKSKTRRALYESGSYVPTSYLVVWPRRALLAWAARQDDRAEEL
ncbi:MAG TPA: hypothetical protein VLA09_12155, partial [Longimicrobiales bacterium]|nr:hypothetical protein [Longimicrobiales bacterium]